MICYAKESGCWRVSEACKPDASYNVIGESYAESP